MCLVFSIKKLILAATLIQAFGQLFRSLTWAGPYVFYASGEHTAFTFKHIWQYFIAKPTTGGPGVFLVMSP